MTAPETGADPSTLAARLLRDHVPPSLIIDLFDPVGMQRALASELAEVQAAQVLAEVAGLQRVDWTATA